MERIISTHKGEEHILLYDTEDQAIIDSCEWYAVKTNPASKTFYAMRGKRYLHRELIPGSETVDHVNGNGLDNRRSNLRSATRSQNQGNRRPSSTGTSVYKGVSRKAGRTGWRVVIKRRDIGMYPDEVMAALAYDQAALELWGEFAQLNFPRGASA